MPRGIYSDPKLEQSRRQRISEALKGRPSPLRGRVRPIEVRLKIAGPRYSYNVGPNNYMYGKTHDKATRQLISEQTKARMTPEICAHLAELGRKKIGPLNPLWKGGWVNPGYPQEFSEKLKEQIRDRDNHKCRACGILEFECSEVLHIHHIDSNRNNCSEDNLISLCRGCHNKTRWYSLAEILANVGGDAK